MAAWDEVSDFIRKYVNENGSIPNREQISLALPNHEVAIDAAMDTIAERLNMISVADFVTSLAAFGLGGKPTSDSEIDDVLRKRLQERANFEERLDQIKSEIERLPKDDPPPDDIA